MGFFEEVCRSDDAAVAIQMQLQAAHCAADLLPFLPQLVAGMAIMNAIERAVQAWCLDVGVEGLLIDPLVDTGSTLCAFEVSCGLLKMMLVGSRCRVDLGLEQVPDDLGTGELFGGLGGFLPWIWTCIFGQLLGASFS